MGTIKEIVIKVLIGAGFMYVLFFIYNKVKVTAYSDVTIEVTYQNDRQDTFDLVVVGDSSNVYQHEGDIKYRPYIKGTGLNKWLVVASFVRRYRILSYQEHKIK